ncbi:MAG TPA: stalk domain-containing protein [Symbiobacteriaceae bacterium]|nr:stalk domain-containing protein [Symbiobacteriaceae bacterium]
MVANSGNCPPTWPPGRRLENVTYTGVMTVDSPDYTWNGSAYQADVPPYKAGSVVMIPLRVVAPALGFGLAFNSADRTATLQWFE